MLATLFAGLVTGAVYVIVAVGFNLTWITSRLVNFALPVFLVLGMFVSVSLQEAGLPTVAVLAILVIVGSIVALIEFFVAIRPIESRGQHAELVTTVGWLTVVQGVILYAYGEDVRRVFFPGVNTLVDLPGGKISVAEMVLLAAGVVTALGAHLWLTRTRRGMAALALSEDPEAATVLGINSGRFSMLMFVFSGALACALGPVVGTKTFAVVTVATVLAVKGFVVLALGGVGSQAGALIGGLFVGVVEALTVRYIGGSWQNIIVFLIFMVVLTAKPTGLFGEKSERLV